MFRCKIPSKTVINRERICVKIHCWFSVRFLYIFKYMGCSLKKVKQFLKNPKVGFPKFIREN
ncbi:hypothetical protein E4413_10950 [Leptospira interrogans]|nr:hypothetical protein C5473_01295 [Leptospira interrogans serovar Weerasinghe]KAA1288302.1 hypothetical protein C4X99_22465 [Leptospira interrogans serovar Geyaweera]QCO33486.1 hypothetical protein E4414_10715 [Leptospira interrogans]QCO37126.1 hypothetical protein E4412_07800 [Leptospira interrogans]QCO41368.1 hypothetical protein E4413_10950 [Leptospira interrogans]